MAANKTIANDTSVNAFIDTVEDERKRADSHELIELMRTITGHEPKLWGNSLIGFDSYHYRYASGREGDFFITGFSPRKTALAIYIMPGFDDYAEQLQRLGPHKTGKSCLYVKNLDAIDRDVLEEIIRDSVSAMRERYPGG
jgi:hypothetical protein